MDAEEFRTNLLRGLRELTPEQKAKIRKEFYLEGDYGVDAYGRSYWIKPTEKQLVKAY